MKAYDLPAAILSLTKYNKQRRVYELQGKVPSVGLVGFNGVPFKGEPATFLGQEVTPDFLRQLLEDALGFGGVLTYLNSSKMTLRQLSNLCLKQDHDWAFRAVHLTVAFVGAPAFVEMSFARDRRFHLSWVEEQDVLNPCCFTASASVKDWSKYLENRNSEDFLEIQRQWLLEAHSVLAPILPEYFGE